MFLEKIAKMEKTKKIINIVYPCFLISFKIQSIRLTKLEYKLTPIGYGSVFCIKHFAKLK